MEEKRNNSKLEKSDIFLGLILIFVVIYELISMFLLDKTLLISLINMSVTRVLAGVFFLLIAIKRKYKLVNFEGKNSLLGLVSILPCFLVVINNLPIIALVNKDVAYDAPLHYLLLFILQCIAIGFFEEIAFRGVFFLMFLKTRRNTKGELFKVILISSVVFGMYHIFNLLEGANPLGVLMQVGYSALIGAMCAMIFLITKNIFIPIIIHSGFDFCGTLIPTLGKGSIWNTPTVIITIVIAVAVFVFMLCLFIKFDVRETDCFYKDLQ